MSSDAPQLLRCKLNRTAGGWASCTAGPLQPELKLQPRRPALQVPTAPRKDLIRLINNDRIVLRFGARLLPDTANRRLANLEGARRFVISFHMADDTLSIYEPPTTKNSGVEGGKFLERAKAFKGRSETVRVGGAWASAAAEHPAAAAAAARLPCMP